MATLVELRTQVRTATRVPVAIISDAELTTWINEGLYRVAAAARWPWLEDIDDFTTTATQQNYPVTDVATDVDRIVSIYSDTKSVRLQQMSPQTALEHWGGDFPEGEHADTYFLFDSEIHLIPIPDSDSIQYNAYYYKSPTPLGTLGFADTLDEVGDIDDSQTSFTVDNGAGWPATPFTILVGTERMRVTDVSTDEFTVTRGYDGTTAAIALDGATITLYADRPEWDVLFHHVLAHYGEMRVWQFEEDTGKAREAERQYLMALDQMIRWYKDIADGNPWAVGVPQSRRSTRTNTPFLDG